jgi:hypothetical protein
MNEILKAKIENITDSDKLCFEYSLMWVECLDELIPKKEAAEHGESPMWKKIFDMSKDDKYIDNLPLFE